MTSLAGMLVAAAVCPHPPLLLPAVAAGAASELDQLRGACRQAVSALARATPDLLVVVGAADRPWHGAVPGQLAAGQHPAGVPAPPPTRPEPEPYTEYPSGSVGTLRGYGVAYQTTLGPGSHPPEPAAELPLSLTVAGWLLQDAGWTTPLVGVAVHPDAAPGQCRSLGQRLAARADRTALLALGDGSARRDQRSPGWAHERAVPHDDAVAAALAGVDLVALDRLDAAEAAELMAGGRAAWQVLAGAAAGAGLRGEQLAYESRYGVAYHVASWT